MEKNILFKINIIKVTLYFVFLLLGVSSMETAVAEPGSFKKPYYTLEISGKQTGVEIRINDIPVFNVDNTGFLTTEIPIGEYLTHNSNIIKVISFPLFNDDDIQEENYISGSTITVSLYVREDEEPTEKRVLLNSSTITPSNAYSTDKSDQIAISNTDKNTIFETEKNATILNLPPYGVYKKQVVVEWNFPDVSINTNNWYWENTQLIHNNQETYKSLMSQYQKVYDAFKNKNLSLIKEISKVRSKELSDAYYLGGIEEGFEYSSFGKFIDHKSAELYEELNTEDVTLQIVANGKMARIIDGSGIHPVVFVNYDTEQVYKPQFLWSLNNNNEWVLVR